MHSCTSYLHLVKSQGGFLGAILCCHSLFVRRTLLHKYVSRHNCVVLLKHFIFSLRFTTNVSHKLQEYKILEVFDSSPQYSWCWISCLQSQSELCCMFMQVLDSIWKNNNMWDQCVLFKFNVHYNINCWFQKKIICIVSLVEQLRYTNYNCTWPIYDSNFSQVYKPILRVTSWRNLWSSPILRIKIQDLRMGLTK